MVAIWVLFAQKLPDEKHANGVLAEAYKLGGALGTTAILAAATFAAYLIGSLTFISPVFVIYRLWPVQWHLEYPKEKEQIKDGVTIVRYGLRRRPLVRVKLVHTGEEEQIKERKVFIAKYGTRGRPLWESRRLLIRLFSIKRGRGCDAMLSLA